MKLTVKNIRNAIIAVAFFMALPMAAQQSGQVNQDELQQQPPRESKRELEKAARVDAAKKKSDADFQAEKRAKDKGRTQKQTTAERPVSDSVRQPKEIKPQVQHESKPN